jgi:flagellar biosynthesis protein FlhF
MLFTKLDESTGFGSIFNHSIRFKLPIAYLTTGQKVPEDIEVATKERLVDLLLNITGS